MTDGSALSSEDFSIDRFTVVMNEGEIVSTLPVYVKDDVIPESDEWFLIRILPDSLTGGVALGAISECRINILANDFPSGLFGLLFSM